MSQPVAFDPEKFQQASDAAQGVVQSAVNNVIYRTQPPAAPVSTSSYINFDALSPQAQYEMSAALRYMALNQQAAQIAAENERTNLIASARYALMAQDEIVNGSSRYRAWANGMLEDDLVTPTKDWVNAEDAAAIGQEGIQMANELASGEGAAATQGIVETGPRDLNAMFPYATEPMLSTPNVLPGQRPLSMDEVRTLNRVERLTGNRELVDRLVQAKTHFSPGGLAYADRETQTAWLLENYPTLAIAAETEGWSTEDVAKTTNFSLAYDTAIKVASEPSEVRARQMLASIPPAQKALVYDLISEVIADKDMAALEQSRLAARKEAREEMLAANQTIFTRVGQFAWDWAGPGSLLNALSAANEFGQHAGRAALYAYEQDLANPDIIAGWQATDHGQWDEPMLQQARTKYGDKTVNIILDALNAKNEGDTDAYLALRDKYANDDEAGFIISHAIDNIDTDENIQNAIKDVTAANNANLGNMAGRLFNLDPTMSFGVGGLGDVTPFELTRDITNVTGAIALDPLLAAGLAGKAVNSVRYGMWMLMDAERSAAILKGATAPSRMGTAMDMLSGRTAVRRYFNWLGSEMEKVRGLKGLEQAQALTTLRSQSSKYISADALESMLKFGVKDAETTHDWLQGADNLVRMMRGQASVRARNLRMPHMNVAQQGAKRASLAMRGLDPTRVITSRAQRELITVFGDDFMELPLDDQIKRFVATMENEDDAMRVSAAISDLRDIDKGGVRTTIGKVVDSISRKDGVNPTWTQRYGWKRRKGQSVFGAFQDAADRVSRMLARMPDTTGGIATDTAADMEKVYQMMRLAGVPRYWASYFRSAWTMMDQGQRRLTLIGLTRTFGYASGIHLVAPERGMDDLLETVTGVRTADLFAPTVSRKAPNLAARAQNEIDAELGPDVTEAERALAIKMRLNELAKEEGLDLTNPSIRSGISSAVFMGQTRNRMALPNFQAIDNLRARSNFMGSLLMRNRVGSSVTDAWTLATLAGPRFSLRNGIEDFGMYALTGGSMRQFWRGRQASTALRESTMRGDAAVAAAQTDRAMALENLEKLRRSGAATPFELERAQERVNLTSRRLETARSRTTVRGQKLGIVKTAMRGLGDRIPVMQSWILPHLTAEEIEDAARAAAAGDREPLSQLMVRAFLRQKLLFIKNDDVKKLVKGLNGNVSRADLSPRLNQILDDLDDFVDSTFAVGLQDEFGEASRHLVDGTMVAADDGASTIVTRGRQAYVKSRLGPADYHSVKVTGTSPTQVRAVMIGLHFALHTDGPKSQRAMAMLPEYFAAVARGAKDADGVSQAESIVDDLARYIETSPSGWDYTGRFALAHQEDAKNLARSTLDTLMGMFTRQDGKFNDGLYRAVQVPGAKGTDRQFALRFTDDAGNKVENVTMADFAEGALDMPMFTLTRSGDEVWVPTTVPFTNSMWAAMGRSLARMTREPIFTANYLEARKALRPLEKRLIEMGIPADQARKRVTDLAGERAYNLGFAYADNPNVRSQLAWSLRNVARFYRAQEDFVRRLWRTGANDPIAFWKAALVWDVAQDVGFVHTDEYGEQYFIYPGSRPGLEASARIFSGLVGQDNFISTLPMVQTGNVQWLSPSADPESWAPTLSSPWAAVALRPLLRSLPVSNEVERALFGPIGEDKSIMDTVLPPNINKALQTVNMFSTSRGIGLSFLPDSLAATSARKAALMLAASGDLPTDGTMDDDERRDWIRRLDNVTTGLMIFNAVTGFFLPAAPQIKTDEVTKFARELDLTGLRPALIKELQSLAPGESYETALMRFYKVYGWDAAIYSVSNSGESTAGFWRSVKDNENFIVQNRDLFESSPNGLSYFAPQTGRESVVTYSLLKSIGASTKKPAIDYLDDLSQAQGEAAMLDARIQYENKMAELASKGLSEENAAEARKVLDAAYMAMKRQISQQYRVSGDDMGFASQGDYANKWDTIVRVGRQLAERGDPLAKDMLPFFATVDDVRARIERLRATVDPEATKQIDMMRAAWDSMITENVRSVARDERYMRIWEVGTYYVWGPNGNWSWRDPMEEARAAQPQPTPAPAVQEPADNFDEPGDNMGEGADTPYAPQMSPQ